VRSGQTSLVAAIAVTAALLAAILGAASPTLAAAVEPSGGRPPADNYIPWPSLLPGRQVGPAGPPRGLPGCRALELSCVDRLVRRMRAQKRADDRTCDHRVIFSLGYLRITNEIRRRLRAHESFVNPRWFIGVVQGFSNLYFQAQRRYDRGDAVPEAWRIYYEAMDSGDFNAGQDLLLASNAHVNHDLPYAYAAAGLLARDGTSRKHDHDEVNDVNATVYEGIAGAYAKRYDPFFSLTNLTHPFDQLSLSQVIQGWREDAWRQAERLLAAKSKAELQRVQQDIERKSAGYARLITGGSMPGHREVRDDYCRAQHTAG
jgi:hypothetical protein